MADTKQDVLDMLAELVELRFFCGYSFAEIAQIRGVSERTVHRDWRKARVLLYHTLLAEDAPPPSRPASALTRPMFA